MSVSSDPSPGLQESTRRIIFLTKSLRTFGDGLLSVGLAQYALALGLSNVEAGALASLALVGTTVATLLVGQFSDRVGRRRTLAIGACLMVATGLGYASTTSLAALFVIAFLGTVNPTSGDVSSFLPLEHAILGQETSEARRVTTFAWFNVSGTLAGALGALLSGITPTLAGSGAFDELGAIRALFGIYSLLGVLTLGLVLRIGPDAELSLAPGERRGLGRSRGTVFKLSGLFMLDSFGGGLVVQSIIALFLFRRFELSEETTASVFFVAGLFQAGSFLVAARLARRIGLVNTMVFTHLPANVLLISVAFAPEAWLAIGLLCARSLLSQMDVAPRQALVVSIVEPGERAAAAAITGMGRSLASGAGPSLGGALLSSWAGAPFVVCGAIKCTYDLLLLGTFGRRGR